MSGDFRKSISKPVLFLAMFVFAACLGASAAWADDLNPPWDPQFSPPYSTHSEWVLNPDGTLSDWEFTYNEGPGEYDLFEFPDLGGNEPGPGDPEYYYYFDSDPFYGESIQVFTIPNFVDPFNEKWMRIQVTAFIPDGFEGWGPDVDFVIGYENWDSPDWYEVEGYPVYYSGAQLIESTEDGDFWYWYYDGLMHPNPDFEDIVFFNDGLFEGAYLSQVVIDTVSRDVPLPGAMWLLAGGLLGVFGVRRKK